MHHTQAMGIIAQCTKNLTVHGCCYEVAEDSHRYISLNADGVHCVNCTGLVHISDCLMDGMMDDGINVHGLYSLVDTVGENGAVRLKHIHFQQFGVQVYFPGDEIRFLNAATMQEVGTATVRQATMKDKQYLDLILDIPEELHIESGMVTENPKRMPDVLIEQNRIGRNRPRGVLMNSGKNVLIRNNVFYNSSSGIQIKGGPLFWGESGATNGVNILDNLFEDCCYLDCDATIRVDQVHSDRTHGVPYHYNLTVCNNVFKQFCNCMVYARLLKELTVVNNTFSKTNTYDDHGIKPHIILHDTSDVHTDISEEYWLIEK